jgi:hypothetical protein
MGGDSDALRYLTATNAAAIAINKHPDGSSALIVTTRHLDQATSAYWLPQPIAADVAREARHRAGVSPDVERLVQALQQAAADRRVTLTPHHVAIERAAAAAGDIDRAFEQLRTGRLLRSFNAAYRRHRLAAKADGARAVAYNVAVARLKRVVIQILARGQDPDTAQVNFRALFRPGGARAERPKPKPPTSSWF